MVRACCVRSPTVREGNVIARFPSIRVALDGTPREMLAREPRLTRGLLTRIAFGHQAFLLLLFRS